MNNFKIKKVTAITVSLLLVIIYACNKSFLDKPALGALSPSTLANATGVQSLLIGAYSMIDGEGGAVSGYQFGTGPDNWVFGDVCADDAYKGSTPSDQGDIVPLETWTNVGDQVYTEPKWQALYDGIQRSNDVLRVMRQATDISAGDTAEIAGEAHFLRAFYHFEAKKIWNNVPYVDENITATNANVPNNVDIWPMIEADFQFAISNLPETQPQAGRANKFAAMAFLAKCYMYEHKYSDAKALLDQLIPASYGGTGAGGVTANGKAYALDDNYQDNFNAATKNSAESVFACQYSVNDGSGQDGDYGQVLNFPGGGPLAGCCGFNNPSINLANAYKTDATTGLPLLTTFNSGNVVSGTSDPYTGNLDPRVDFVMGRPGVNFLDWGPMGGSAWVRDPSDGYFCAKKNVYAKAQEGTYSSTETSFWAPTQIDANNYTIIRFAQLLLWDAECEAQIGSLTKAEAYVNEIRNRVATHPETWVYSNGTFNASTFIYTGGTTLADKYLIKPYPAGYFSSKDIALQAIYFETRLELGMEGQRFFDLARWDNGTGSMANTINAYVAVEKTRPCIYEVYPNAHFTKGTDEYFAIPQTEIDAENSTGTINLTQNPGY